MGQSRLLRLFEEPLSPGWVYTCSLADIQDRLQRLPQDDLIGLWAVGLAASTQRDCWANGRYRFGDKPTIRLYSYPATYTYRQPPRTKQAEIDTGLAVEMAFGMCVERVGGRYLCRWEAGDLSRFTLEHVLLHEVGHHVYFWRRHQEGQGLPPSRRESEQFAESYALRHAPSI